MSITVQKENKAIALADIVDLHKGKKFLVCGTGPSVDQFHKSFYENWNGVTIGVNDIIELFVPSYHIDIHVKPGFITDNVNARDISFRYRNPSTGVDVEKTGALSMVGTVALTALTAAYQLGASEIHLIGIDLKATPERHHFNGCSSHYIPGGTHVIEKVHELGATIRAFENATKLYQAEGVKVVNLSKNSLLEVA